MGLYEHNVRNSRLRSSCACGCSPRIAEEKGAPPCILSNLRFGKQTLTPCFKQLASGPHRCKPAMENGRRPRRPDWHVSNS